MMTNAALPFKAAFCFLMLCLAYLGLSPPAVAQSAPTKVMAREVLSVSWQPGYCAARPKSRGCADFAMTSPAAKQFSLLSRFQARKSYCGIDAALQQKARKGKWTDLPEIVLASATKDRLLLPCPPQSSASTASNGCEAAAASRHQRRSTTAARWTCSTS